MAEQRVATITAQLARLRPETFAHVRRVAALAVRSARRARLPFELVNEVYWGALVHDVGELNLRRALLDKPGVLSEAERAVMTEHTLIGARWLGGVDGLDSLVPYARWHHERFDGLGYPDGLPGHRIPVGVVVVSVCDAWDALTQSRPYREPLTHAAAVEELQRHAGRQWSRAAVDWVLGAANP
ncbi:MAG TPA: HD domain-containing phosphohydrolase [Acidimicrobiia bacterium]|nr:HD domain-containing phosphohydrolase [Acidimicrobiia bacterium]